MLAASYWSLLAPAIELADASGFYGSLTFLPISLGFAAGAVFVYLADLLLPLMVLGSTHTHMYTYMHMYLYLSSFNKLFTIHSSICKVHHVHEIFFCGDVSGPCSHFVYINKLVL